ncbi:hypothetical protein ACFL9T_04000 [Thermodesulfobacteriota bacterium]
MEKRADLSQPLTARIMEAIDGDKKDEAKKLVKQMARESQIMHDGLLDSVELSLTFISEKLGEESVEEAWRYLARYNWKPAFEMFKKLDHDQIVEILASSHRAHGSEFYVEQDEEKSVFTITDCGGGGKLRKDGKLDYTNRHPMDGGATKKPYRWSCDQTGMPYYCVHGPVWLDSLPMEWGWGIFDFQYGRQFDDDGNPVNEPCREIIYRKPRSA